MFVTSWYGIELVDFIYSYKVDVVIRKVNVVFSGKISTSRKKPQHVHSLMIAVHCFLLVRVSKEGFLCPFQKRSCCVKWNKGLSLCHPHTAAVSTLVNIKRGRTIPATSSQPAYRLWSLDAEAKEGGAQRPTQLFKYYLRNREVAHNVLFKIDILFLFWWHQVYL